MKKRFIKIPKDFFKDLNFEIKLVPHSNTPKCVCYRCIKMYNEQGFLGLQVYPMFGNKPVTLALQIL